jgi:GH25 family lysozyme M1 (1,4-beta-N-acetylmuramidase)
MIIFDFRYCVPPYPEYAKAVAIKLTQGRSFINPLAERQANGNAAVAAHWHYWEPGVDPKVQAAHYWSVAQHFAGERFLDAEYQPAPVKGTTPGQLKAFVDEFEQLSGGPIGVYTRKSWWSYYAGVTTWAGSRRLWVAHYGASVPAIPAEWQAYDVWQFQGDARWPGWKDETGRPCTVDVDHYLPDGDFDDPVVPGPDGGLLAEWFKDLGLVYDDLGSAIAEFPG